MTEKNPVKPAYDMKRFRLAIRGMWRSQQTLYRAGGFLHRGPDGRLAFRKVPFPELADFEIRAERRRGGEDRL